MTAQKPADVLGAYVYLPGRRRKRLMSATARNQVFSAVHTIGGLLPADMLVRISRRPRRQRLRTRRLPDRRRTLGARRRRTPLGLPQVDLGRAAPENSR